MNLIWFLTIGTILSLFLGEFGQFPFGVTSRSVSVTDLLLATTVIFLFIWQFGIKKKIFLPKSFFLICLFWVVALISLIFSLKFSGGLYLIRFIFYSLSFYIGFSLIKEGRVTLDRLFEVISIPSLIITFTGFLQLIFYPDLNRLTDFGYDPHQGRLVSTFLDPNFLGGFLSITSLVFIYLFIKSKKLVWLFSFFLIFLAVLLTFSRSAYLTFFVQVLIISLLKYRKILLILLIVPILLYLFIPRFSERVQGALRFDVTAKERIESWQKGFYIFQQQPILGIGFNNLRDMMEQYQLLKVYSADGGNSGAGLDSSFIVVLATTGVIGFTTYLLWWLSILKSAAERFFQKKNSLSQLIVISLGIGLMINSQFINGLFYPPIMFLSFLILGAVNAQSE